MITNSFKIIFLLSLVSFIFTQDCGSPVECYVKAINSLNDARDQYRKMTEETMKIYKKAEDALKIANQCNNKSDEAIKISKEANQKSDKANSLANTSSASATNALSIANQANHKGDVCLARKCSLTSKFPSNSCRDASCGSGWVMHGAIWNGNSRICDFFCCNY